MSHRFPNIWTAITASNFDRFDDTSSGKTQNVSGSISRKCGVHPAVVIALKTTGQQKRGTPISEPGDKLSALIAATSPALPALTGIQLPIPAI
jgi:hypothetical protein